MYGVHKICAILMFFREIGRSSGFYGTV